MYKILKSHFRFLLFVVLCEVVWIGTAFAAPSRQLVIKGDRAFPPYEFINEQGEPDGFNVELIHAVMKKVGIPYTLSLEHWPQVVKEFRDGKVDVITGIMYTNRRAEIFKFGAIHTFVYQDVVYRKGRTPVTDLKELEGLEIIVQEGAITQEILENLAIRTHIIVVPDLYVGLRMLSEGRHDVALCNEEMALSIIKKLGLDNLEMSELDLPPDEYCFAGKNDSLLTVIDKAFYKLQREGEYDRIYNKWFSTPLHNVPRWIYIALGILVLVVTIGYLFIILLRRQVKIANNEVRMQNQKLSLAIKGSNTAFWEFDVLTGIFKAYNDPVNDYHEDQILTLDDYHRYMQAADLVAMKPYVELMQEGRDETYSLDVRVKTHHDKDWRDCTITGTPFEKDPLTGRVIKYVGFRRDNTEIVKLNREVNEYVQKMRYVFNHSNVMIWEFDIAGRKIQMDYGGENRMETLSVEELLQERIVPSRREEVRLFLNRLIERLEDEFTLQWEMLPLKNSGKKEVRYVIINGMPIKDADGKITAYSGLRRDITDLILTQNRLEHETQRALQSDKLKSAFLANMSHEIRTPLNAIVGFSGLLQETDDPQERKEYTQIINTNNELLLNLINDILDLSRIESGEVTLYNEHFDLAHYFENLAASLQQRCTNPDVRFIVEKPYVKCNVCLDRSRIAQILTNFATNAIKHTQSGYIKMGYVCEEGGIRLYTEDTGSGIPAEKQHLVFQRFEKLDPFVQGTGLGLSICKAIVDACGGEIGFTSEEGEGSGFWAWLPCGVEVVSLEQTQE